MKKTMFILALIVVNISLFGCDNETPSQSTFKSNFSLNSIIENNREYLLEEARMSSGAESGLREPFEQSHEEITVQINPTNISILLQAIRLEIGQSLADNNASVLGHEVNGNANVGFFSYSYSENGLYGTVMLWGVPGDGTGYTLIVMITEG